MPDGRRSVLYLRPPPLAFFYKNYFLPSGVFGMIKYLSRNPWQSVGCKGGGAKGNPTMSAPFGKPPPSSPDKYSVLRLGSVLPFIVSMKTTSGGGCTGEYLYGAKGGVLVWADHFFIPSVTHMFNMGGNEFDYELMNKNEILEFRASYDDFSESMTYRVLSHRNGQKTSS